MTSSSLVAAAEAARRACRRQRRRQQRTSHVSGVYRSSACDMYRSARAPRETPASAQPRTTLPHDDMRTSMHLSADVVLHGSVLLSSQAPSHELVCAYGVALCASQGASAARAFTEFIFALPLPKHAEQHFLMANALLERHADVHVCVYVCAPSCAILHRGEAAIARTALERLAEPGNIDNETVVRSSARACVCTLIHICGHL
jgi:hypothetical protein